MITRNFRGWAIALAIGLLGWLAPVEAWAACTSSDRAGTWQIYSLFTDNVDSGWHKCKVRIAAGGGVRSGTRCVTKDAGTGATSSDTVQGGNINIQSSCKITGYIKISGCRITINEGWISRDKTMMSAVGTDCQGSIFQLNGVRR